MPAGRWILVLTHHPMFSAHPYRDPHSTRWAWQPLFQRYGVDLVFTGHDHHYQRCHPIGSRERAVVHFTSGGGGAGLYPVDAKPWTANAVSVHNGTILDFEGDQLRVRAFSDTGELLDEHRIVRDLAIPVEELVSYEALQWGRDLRAGARTVVEVGAEGGLADVRAALRVPSPFADPLRLRWSWSLGSAWQPRETRADGEVILGALRGLSLPLAVRAVEPWPACLPPPSLHLELATPEGERAFRNNAVELQPFRLWPRRTLPCGRRPELVSVDSEPIEWEGVAESGDFCLDDGSRLATVPSRVRAVHDARGLCFFAYLRMSDDQGFFEGTSERDSRDILDEDESFTVWVLTDQHHYTFAVNTRNAQLDAVDGDREASPGFESAVQKAAASWYCELRIPWASLRGEIRRINVGRRDHGSGEASVWVPTFGDATGARYGWLGR